MKPWQLLSLTGAILGVVFILGFLFVQGSQSGAPSVVGGDVPVISDTAYSFAVLGEHWRQILLATSITGLLAIIVALRFVSEQTQTELNLRRSEERFRAVVDNSPTQIHIKDLNGRYLLINREAEKLFGITDTEGRGKTSYDIFPAAIADSVAAHDRAVLDAGAAVEKEEEFQLEGGTRTYLTVKFPIRDEGGDIAAVGAVSTDITQRKRDEAEHMEYLALHDSLTDLPNRFLFHDRLETAVAQSMRTGGLIAVLCLDLDDFKSVNDTLGHRAGDELLKGVAERLQSYLRRSDTIGRHQTTVARIGGDEFTVLLTNLTEPLGAATVAERIIEDLSRPFTIGGQEAHTGVCIGIAVYPSHDDRPEELVKKADLALNRAKSLGRNTYHFYSQGMETEIRARKGLEQDLHRALAEGQLALAYQPQMDIRTGAVTGMEALLRWNHPGRGAVPPAEFIPIAEATGLIVPMGEWALREACRQNKAWRDAGLPDLTVAVNISAAQFRREDLMETVEAAIRDSGLDPAALQIEITESLFIQDGARDTLLDFGQRGISVALDDFGTGYSSLSYLTRFPIDKIKLDSSFVRDIHHDTSSAAIIQAVVNLGHSIGMRVNVEGVEAADELAILSGYGVDEVQGYYLSQPLSADAFAEFVAHVAPPVGELPKSA